jgi:hypothetical protein
MAHRETKDLERKGRYLSIISDDGEARGQRVLNDLQYRGPGLSCRRMLRLHAHPLPKSPVSKLPLFLSLLCVAGRAY